MRIRKNESLILSMVILLISSTACYSAPVVKNIPVEATIMSTVTITKANGSPLEHIALKFQPHSKITSRERYSHTENIKLTTNTSGEGINIRLKEKFILRGYSGFEYRRFGGGQNPSDPFAEIRARWAAEQIDRRKSFYNTVKLAGKTLSIENEKYTLDEINDSIPLSISAGNLRGNPGDIYKGIIKLVVEPIL